MRRVLIAAALFTAIAAPANAQNPRMNFFLTSSGPGDGANLGGLAGADGHCQQLAYAAGFGDKTWRAYLSAAARDNQPAVNARDRIGRGPFYNFKGEVIAQNVDELHSDKAVLTKQSILSEKGELTNGRGDTPNRHDVLTGSTADGRLFAATADAPDTTCNNWTSNSTGAARLGHHDRQGGGDAPTSWNSAHLSRGCSQQNLVATGGNGLFFCFAVN
jgi:hypothetical protein